MKHLLNTTLLLLALLLPANATAHDFEVDGIYYSIMSYTTVKVSGYNSSILDGNIVIPDYVINNYMEYDVVAIADSAFYGSDISSVRISEYITAIGDKAFYGCNNLNDVYSSIANPSQISMGQNVFELYHDPYDNQYESLYTNRLLHVPTGSVTAYQADSNWEPFFEFIVDKDNVTISDLKFEIDNIVYIVTSDTTVKVSGPSYRAVPRYGLGGKEGEVYLVGNFLEFNIPNQVTYNDKDYTITEIGDRAFFFPGFEYGDEGYIAINYNITIPETVTSIGLNAFGGKVGMVNVICQSMTPPIMNDNDFSGIINLFVPADAYSLYQENNNQNHYFNTIYITNGEKSSPPIYVEQFLYQPVTFTFDGPYGISVKIFPTEKSTIYIRESINECGLYYNHIYNGNWMKYEERDSIYFYYEPVNDGGAVPNGWAIEFFAIEEGKSPSADTKCGLLDKFSMSYKNWQSYDFIDSDIAYINYDNAAAVSYQGYIDPWGYKAPGKSDSLINHTNLNTPNRVDPEDIIYAYNDIDKFIYYSGDIMIPDSVIYHNFENDSFTTLPVTSICWRAFKNCVNLNSVTIPKSIKSIHGDAFHNCIGLTRVNITDLDAWCNIDFEGPGEDDFGSSNPLKYASHLYLNDSEITDLIIPNTVTSISDNAFYGYRGLTSVTLSNSVTSIGYDAFSACSNLRSITIPSSVSDVGCIRDCPNLSFIKCLGATPPNAEDYSFDEGVCQNTTLYVPLNAINAYRNAEGWKNFQNIVGFIDYDFVVDGISYLVTSDEEAVVVHGEEAYQGNVVIPGTVTYEGTTYTVTGIGSEAFANATVNCLTLPVDVINNIASDAFEGSNIQSVYITGNGAWTAGALPSNVENLYIGSGVTAVPGLQVNPTTFYSYATVPPTCDENSFTGYDAALHVPASSLASYFTAPYWSNFINIVGDAIEPTAVTLDNDSISILIGNQVQLTATIEPENATPNQILWTSSDSSVATVVDGMIQAVAVGECDIKAWLLDKSAVCHVTVTEIAPTEVTLNQTFAKLEIGSQLSLTATVLPDDATDKVITWTTSNSAVATVDSLGNVIAVGPGECSITASCRDKQATCHVIVVEHLIFITLDQHELSVLPNHIEMLTPSVSPVSTDLRVTSSDPAVAAARLANGKIQVVGITEGTTTITIGSVDGYAEPDSCVVTVYTERGDVNNDGFVNITDAIDLINDILNDASASFYTVNADCNNDGEVNISDVMRLINYILSGAELEPKETTDPTQAETETITVNGVSFTMVKVDGGSFMMGCTPEQNSEAGSNEAPVHRVTLSTYYMGQTEVTQELWQAVMGSNPSNFANDAQNPVEKVTWNDCQEFISQLNQLTGKTFRLPTEAEWEYAACGGNKSHGYTYSGSNDINEIAWFSDNSENTTHPVGLKKANELGLFDMTGNVYEWCYDRYGYYPEAPQTDPQGPETGSSKIYRGGGWMSAATSCRNTRRNFFAPGAIRNFMGLRLVMVP